MYFNFQLFYLFSFLICFCGFAVIFSQNPIHSILILVFLFFNAASLLILLGADFLAILFLIVYVGAVAVLFLFVIMMLSGKLLKRKINFFYIPLIVLLALIFLFEIFLIIEQNLDFLSNNIFSLNEILNPLFLWQNEITFFSNVEIIGSLIYTYFFYFSLNLFFPQLFSEFVMFFFKNRFKSYFFNLSKKIRINLLYYYL